ncbi:MAG: substrate-binding domain-containing protein [Caldilineaceae bacterium]|nr:substrate-binding domain-containing protein [Caldilineaceae bacterium]MBP8108473.1 substrate-binding domain-containing protein [Caldilineaceae bacterium]MBP8123698.1 substrate-binding domain-containing protein [Caldilineaceae bacterium]MBP9073826.1 substrate-binding domain-containing protein [Caldilineaceae bacterium]
MTTISDVAKRAGVSPVTVSRVINDTGNVRAATLVKVEKAIEELGYVPSGAAQSLRSKRTHALALIVPDIQNAFWTTAARGVEDAAQSRGYSVFLCNTDESAAKQERYLSVVISQRVDGVIIAPYDTHAANLAILRRRNVPTVVIDRHIDGWDVDTVVGDSLAATRALARHLIELGHKRIAMVSGPVNTSTGADRVAGYRIALAEAGIPFDSDLVKYGEYRSISGERLTHQLLNAETKPTAIFAANNAIAMGILDALDARGLRVPEDIALVCFDDLPNTSRLFPFLTVAAQPAYDIGANAAQLLLSRMESDTPIAPRQVVLPTRLIVRHSCGAALADDSRVPVSLPLRREAGERSYLVKPLTPTELNVASSILAKTSFVLPWRGPGLSKYDKSDAGRLCKVFKHQETDRVAHFEMDLKGRRIFEYVLERKLTSLNGNGEFVPSPADHVEFAARLGMDAVMCEFIYRPNTRAVTVSDGTIHYAGGQIKSWADLDRLDPPQPLADQLDHLETYLRAADGTGVGVFAGFSSFFHTALTSVGIKDSMYLLYDDRLFLERLMDILLQRQERVVQAVCDRFGRDLSFVAITDELAHNRGPMIAPQELQEIYIQRVRRLIEPALAYDIPVALHTQGKIDTLLPMLYDAGFSIIHPLTPEANDIAKIKAEWAGKLILAGNFPSSMLLYGSDNEIDEQVRTLCERIGLGGDYVFSTAGALNDGIPPNKYVTMVEALHRHGRGTVDSKQLD